MFRTPDYELHTTELELQAAETELADLKKELGAFESLVDARLGGLLDQLSELNAETSSLNEQLRHIREQRLFGPDLMQYLDGAPLPARPTDLDSLPPMGLPPRGYRQALEFSSAPARPYEAPDIKVIYRKLARRYHPDLARSDADRARSNDQMKTINQAYSEGDLATLMKLAGMSFPYGIELGRSKPIPGDLITKSKSKLEETQGKLREMRQQIRELTNLPIVKLSLDVKLARHQGRDLMGEMAGELRYKVARKTAERDYLRSQINASTR
jgi:hypothetical protein